MTDLYRCLQTRTDWDCKGKSQNYIKHYKMQLRQWEDFITNPLCRSNLDEEESAASEDAFEAAMDCIYGGPYQPSSEITGMKSSRPSLSLDKLNKSLLVGWLEEKINEYSKKELWKGGMDAGYATALMCLLSKIQEGDFDDSSGGIT